jgi:hypothetical protein
MPIDRIQFLKLGLVLSTYKICTMICIKHLQNTTMYVRELSVRNVKLGGKINQV